MNKLKLQRQVLKFIILLAIIGGIYKACSRDKENKVKKETKTSKMAG